MSSSPDVVEWMPKQHSYIAEGEGEKGEKYNRIKQNLEQI